MEKKKKILYISGTRADYGLMSSVIQKINESPKLDLYIAATGMHLMKEFGSTVSEIEKDCFKLKKINCIHKKDDYFSMAEFVGNFTKELTSYVHDLKPDIILVLGDRGEMLAGAIAGTYCNIPVAHVQGGELSGTVDGIVRHAITKLAHIHFVATKTSAERLIKSGENPSRIHIVGAPGLDDIVNSHFYSKKDLYKELKLDPCRETIILIQHPVTGEDNSDQQIKETLEAIKEMELQSVVIYPNADAGGRKMIDVIKSYELFSFIHTFKNISREKYLSLVKYSDVLIGNSSSGIIEAASFKVPVINIGTRQQGRECSANIIHVGYYKEEIKNALRTVSSQSFKNKLRKCVNIYGNGTAGSKIVKVLEDIQIAKNLLRKNFDYKEEQCRLK